MTHRTNISPKRLFCEPSDRPEEFEFLEELLEELLNVDPDEYQHQASSQPNPENTN